MGEWSLADFPADLDGLSYRVSCPGFESTTDMGTESFLGNSGLSYASLRDGSAVIKLKRGLPLTGQVRDESGEPIANCRLTIGKDIWGTNCPVTTTDAHGQYIFKGLSKGKVWITAESPNHRPEAKEITLPLIPATLDFTLKPGKILRGRVAMPDGTPCAALNVGVDKWTSLRTLSFSTQTDAEGNFVWNGAPDAPVEFNFGGCQNREFLAGLWLEPSPHVHQIVMKPALRISGTVVDAKTGQPVKDFTLTPGRRQGPDSLYWNETSASKFDHEEFQWETNRMEGIYVLRFEAPGYRKYETRDFKANQQAEIVNVKLQAE